MRILTRALQKQAEVRVSDDLDRYGFIRVTAEGESDIWLTCNACGKSDTFVREDDRIVCRCGETYSHAVTPAGTRVELEGLTFVPWNEGPMQLADLEWNWGRIGAVVVVVVALVGGVAFYFLS